MKTFKYAHTPLDSTAKLDLPTDVQVGMFRSMLRIRRIEEAIEARYHENEMKTPIHLVIGQEATSVGSCTALRKEDLVFSSHRTHGNYLAKGGDLKAMMAEFYCRSTGCAGSRGGSMHLFDKSVGMAGSSAICAGAPPLAAGAALTAQLLKKDYISAVFFGDGASEEGSLWETLNFSALKKLPVIFFCENNFYSVCTPLDKRQPENAELYKKAKAFGVESELIDGTNVVAVYEATQRAAVRAREGGGPTFIEARVYRWRAHGGSGDDIHLGYRDVAEGTDWRKLDPLELYYNLLTAKGLVPADERAKMETEIKAEIHEAFEFAINSPMPEEKDLATFVYAD